MKTERGSWRLQAYPLLSRLGPLVVGSHSHEAFSCICDASFHIRLRHIYEKCSRVTATCFRMKGAKEAPRPNDHSRDIICLRGVWIMAKAAGKLHS